MVKNKGEFVPKLDEAKERLGLLKFWLGIIVGVLIALVGWLASNLETAKIYLLITASVLVIGLTFSILIINKEIAKILKEIRDLKK